MKKTILIMVFYIILLSSFITAITDVELIYPINETSYFGSYNSSIILNVTNAINITTCSVNDTRWDTTIINNTNNICYQEQANISTVCGGFNNGTYNYSIVDEWQDQSYSADSDYTTSTTSKLASGELYMYINYTKVINSNKNSLWQIAFKNQSTGDTLHKNNLSINQCWNGYDNKVMLRVYIHNQAGAASDFIRFSCYNNTNWVNISDALGVSDFSEEAMFWEKNFQDELSFTLINNTVIEGDNITLEYNCTDSINSSSDEFWFFLDTNLYITFYDEQTDSILNVTNGELLVIGEDVSQNITITNQTSVNISLTGGEYELRYTGDGYHRRIYYLTLAGGDVPSINLYLLNESTSISTQIIHTVFDQDGDRAANITVKLQRNYVNDNVSVFKTVSMRRTNFQGEALFYVQLYDFFYKFIYETNAGDIIEISDPAPILTTTPIEQVNLLGDPYLSLREYDSVSYNLSYVNDSGTEYFKFFYSDTTNLVREGCLNVQRITTKGYFDVCYTCVESTSATISCLINTSLDGQFKAVGLIDTDTENSFYALDTVFYDDLSVISYGQEGVFWSTIMIGSLVLMGLGSFTANLLFLILGLVVMVISGFVVGFNIGFIYWIILLAFIVLFMITYSRKGK